MGNCLSNNAMHVGQRCLLTCCRRCRHPQTRDSCLDRSSLFHMTAQTLQQIPIVRHFVTCGSSPGILRRLHLGYALSCCPGIVCCICSGVLCVLSDKPIVHNRKQVGLMVRKSITKTIRAHAGFSSVRIVSLRFVLPLCAILLDDSDCSIGLLRFHFQTQSQSMQSPQSSFFAT